MPVAIEVDAQIVESAEIGHKLVACQLSSTPWDGPGDARLKGSPAVCDEACIVQGNTSPFSSGFLYLTRPATKDGLFFSFR